MNRVVGYKHFCNKLWNATRFALQHFPEGFHAQGLRMHQLTWIDRWVLHRLSECCRCTNEAFEKFELGDAVKATYNFWLYELCDVYLELLKPRLAKQPNMTNNAHDTNDALLALEVLFICFDYGLRLLHPMMPFVTEELYQRLPPSAAHRESICIAAYPQYTDAWNDSSLDVRRIKL